MRRVNWHNVILALLCVAFFCVAMALIRRH